jgi:hypothetical protein
VSIYETNIFVKKEEKKKKKKRSPNWKFRTGFLNFELEYYIFANYVQSLFAIAIIPGLITSQEPDYDWSICTVYQV